MDAAVYLMYNTYVIFYWMWNRFGNDGWLPIVKQKSSVLNQDETDIFIAVPIVRQKLHRFISNMNNVNVNE